jgi:Ca2+-binding RTX toxin-like protein
VFGGPGNDRHSGGAGDDNLNSIDDVVNNDRLDGGTGTDTCASDPDPEVNCEA